MTRPTGAIERVTQATSLQTVLASMARRAIIDPQVGSSSPLIHLRWAKQQIAERGWNRQDWGSLEEGGPVCILESVAAAADSPTTLPLETTEQLYVRLALADLVSPPPAFVSMWNDEQTTVGPINAVLDRAISYAEFDDERGRLHGHSSERFIGKTQRDLMDMFGLTVQAIEEAARKLAPVSPVSGDGGAQGEAPDGEPAQSAAPDSPPSSG